MTTTPGTPDPAAERQKALVVLLHALQRSAVQPPFAMTVLLAAGFDQREILAALDVMETQLLAGVAPNVFEGRG